jgi:hypothetical protein
MRLRIPERRKDIPYFLNLYEDVRQIPGVTEVVINPLTGSLLLCFSGEPSRPVFSSLQQLGLLPPDDQARPPHPVVERFFANSGGGATQIRTVLLVMMVGLAVHQIRRGKILAPALSVLWYAYDLVAAHKREKAILETIPEALTSDPDE